MRFPIRRKVILLTLALSLALVAASVFISSTLFSAQVRNNAQDLVLEAAQTTGEEISVLYCDFLRLFKSLAVKAYAENKEDIEAMSSFEGSFEEKKTFFENLTLGVFPPKSGVGLSYEMAVFYNNYQLILTDLSLVASAGQMTYGCVYYYDEESGNIVYLMDSTSDNSPSYRFPFSVEPVSENLKKYVIGTNKPAAFFEGTSCVAAFPIYDSGQSDKVLAYASYSYDVAGLEASQSSFIRTSALITLGVTLVLALVYFLFVDRFVARHITALSGAAAAFTAELEEKDRQTLEAISGHVKTGDELGDLSEKLDLMQGKIIEYVNSLAEKTAREESIKTELDIASRIQLQSLPESGFSAPGLQLESFIRPAKEVGGDLYDYFMTDDDHLFFAIADVSGKGVPAALFMMRGKELIKAEAGSGRSPGQIAKAVNDELCKNNEEGLFITAFFGIYELSTRRLTYARAGHEQPFLKRAGKAEKISEESNFVLGFFDTFDFAEDSLILEPGDSLLLYTDGLNEGINAQNEEFGYERIRNVLEQTRCGVLPALYRSLTEFADGTEQFDDVTMLLLNAEENTVFSWKNPVAEDISELCDTLEEKLEGYPPDRVAELGIMADEIMTNCISYAFPDIVEPRLDVTLSLCGETVGLTFSDNGIPFDPLHQAPTVDVEDDPFERPEGGMGILMVKQFSDTAAYERKDGRNILRLTRKMV